jgi:hypothetical protein
MRNGFDAYAPSAMSASTRSGRSIEQHGLVDRDHDKFYTLSTCRSTTHAQLIAQHLIAPPGR